MRHRLPDPMDQEDGTVLAGTKPSLSGVITPQEMRLARRVSSRDCRVAKEQPGCRATPAPRTVRYRRRKTRAGFSTVMRHATRACGTVNLQAVTRHLS